MGLEHKLSGPSVCPWCWGFAALQMWSGGVQAAQPDKWSHRRWKGVFGRGLWWRTIGLRVRWGLKMGKTARLGDHQVNWPWVQPVPSKHFTAEFSFHPPKILSLQRAKPSLLCSLRLPALSLSLWSSGAARRSRGRAQHWGFEQAQIPSLGKDSLSRLPPCRLTPYKKGHSG